jgi:pimeloyl-ACP methyl ester carboxylesterase
MLCGCGSAHEPRAFARKLETPSGARLWLQCSGSGPVALADAGLAIPARSWAAVRKRVRHVRFCAFDRAGVGRSDARPCLCGSLQRDVEDEHALVTAAHLERPLILVGHSTGGLDALLYARRYRSEVAALVLVDSPSEAAPPPPGGVLQDGGTRLELASGLRRLRSADGLGDLPIVILSHGRRAFSTTSAERGWTRMQRELAADSSDTLRVTALRSGHLIQVDQPALVAAAVEAAAQRGKLRCAPAFTNAGGRCSR